MATSSTRTGTRISLRAASEASERTQREATAASLHITTTQWACRMASSITSSKRATDRYIAVPPHAPSAALEILRQPTRPFAVFRQRS